MKNKIHYIRDSVFFYFLSGYGTDGLTYACKKQPEVIIYFCHRTDSTACIASADALLDRNGRTDSPDMIYIRFFHSVKKLACIGAQAFYIPTLTFGIQCIHDQG